MKTSGEIVVGVLAGAWSCLVWTAAGLVVFVVHTAHRQAWERAEGALQQSALGSQHVGWVAFVMAIAYALHQIGRAVADAAKGFTSRR